MARYIIKIDTKYFEWSTVVDAPVTNGMTLEEFTEYYSDRYFRVMPGVDELSARMARVEATGTSTPHMTLDEVLAGNRAGKNETCLTKEEILKEYVDEAEG